MGIPVKTEEIDLELRYSAVEVVKNLNTGEVDITVPYQIGFRDEDNNWITVKGDVISISGDASLVLMNITPKDLGKTEEDSMGYLINYLAYAVVTDQIKVYSRVTIDSISSADSNVAAPDAVLVQVKKGDDVLAAFSLGAGETSDKLPVVIGATLEFSAPGFENVAQNVPLLQGDYNTSITLEPAQEEENSAQKVVDSGASDEPLDDPDAEPADSATTN